MENKSVEVEKLEAEIKTFQKALVTANTQIFTLTLELAKLGHKGSLKKVSVFLKSINIDPSQ